MLEQKRVAFQDLFKRKKVSLPMILATFSCIDKNDFIDTLGKYLIDDFDYIISNDNYMNDLSLFILDFLNKHVNNEEELYDVRFLIQKTLKASREFLKPYNKKEKKKDLLYSKASKLKGLLEYDLEYIDTCLVDKNKDLDDYKILEFLIFELKNPDYIFRVCDIKPDFINVSDYKGSKIFNSLVDYYIDNIHDFDDKDLVYYKRVFMILFESGSLKLKNDELNNAYDKLNKIYSLNQDKNIKYLIDLIDNHYPTLNGAESINCVSYIDTKSPVNTSIIKKEDRVDLTNDFTITIDGLRNSKLTNTLFDDAFTLKGSGNDLHILVSVPDVDLFIERDSLLDKFMRGLGESVYARDYKKALIEYDLAKTMSLEKSKVRNCITFDISLDSEANIKGIDFYKSLVKVNYNLTKDKADELMKYHDFDDRLNVLNKMHDLACKLCRKRKDMIGKRSPAKIIMDEFNILPDLVTADYFNSNGIIFPYKNYLGKLKSGSRKNIIKINDFIDNNTLNEESIDMLNSFFDIYNRVFYDKINYGNKTYHGHACGSVGNPLREYMSLETNRLIKDVVIEDKGNISYWIDRVDRDCIEYTETSAKIRTLYESKKGR